MSNAIIARERCEVVEELDLAAKRAREKAARDWNGPLAIAYAQVSNELLRIMHRHCTSCALCQEKEASLHARMTYKSTHPVATLGMAR